MVVSTGKWDLPSPTSLAADLEALTNQISTHFDAIMFLFESNLKLEPQAMCLREIEGERERYRYALQKLSFQLRGQEISFKWF